MNKEKYWEKTTMLQIKMMDTLKFFKLCFVKKS